MSRTAIIDDLRQNYRVSEGTGCIPADAFDGVQEKPSHARQSRRIALIALRLLAGCAIISLLWHQGEGLDIRRVLTLLQGVGAVVVIAFIPPLFGSLADSLGLALCVPCLRPLNGLLKVFPSRIGCDALLNSLPAGIAAAETVRPLWLRKVAGISTEESVAACLTGKFNMAASQVCFYTLILVLLALKGSGVPGIANALSPTQTCLLIVLLPIVVAVTTIFIYSGTRLTQLQQLLMHIAWAPWRRFLRSIESRVAQVDQAILRVVRHGKRRIIGSLAAFLAGWIMLGFESWAILVLLGQHISVGEGLLLEGTVSMLRIVFFFIPSAVGAAEAAYVTLISGFEIADPASVAVAFIAIKRSREILWIGAGYSVFLFSRWTRREREGLGDSVIVVRQA